MQRLAFLFIFGLGGAAILISLGVWQMQRLNWKEAILADIEARIAADPVPLPAQPDPQTDAYLPVSATGIVGTGILRVLVSRKEIGAGYRIIQPLITGSRTILVDRGFVAVDIDLPVPTDGAVEQTIVGNLQWPNETDSYTPAPDLKNNVWFARDVPAMAAALGTEPILIVQRETSQSNSIVTPFPVDTSAIPNDHLQYAITWFSLAAVWLAMTAHFLRRPRDTKRS